MGNSSSCAAPSCAMGCVFASAGTLSACNATCYAAKASGCSFKFGQFDMEMCGDCVARWLDPSTLTPEILPGAWPYWPPGFQLPSCTSCDDIVDECYLGCRMAFDPSLNPLPPSPTPPPAVPLPPAPWPNTASGFNFSTVFSDLMVLQRAPAAAAVFGNVGGGGGDFAVRRRPRTCAPSLVSPAARTHYWRCRSTHWPLTLLALCLFVSPNCAVHLVRLRALQADSPLARAPLSTAARARSGWPPAQTHPLSPTRALLSHISACMWL